MKLRALILICLIVVIGGATFLLLKVRNDRETNRKVGKLAELAGRADELRKQNQTLSKRLSQVMNTGPVHVASNSARSNEMSALLTIKAELEAELGRLEDARADRLKAGTAEKAPPLSLEQEAYFSAITKAKIKDGHMLALAVGKHPFRDNGQFPTNLDQVRAALTNYTDYAAWTGTNEFEIVYQGSRDDWTSIPWGAIAILRERQPWKGPNGKWTRVYGMGDGTTQLVESDDDFRSWEAVHVIPAK